ncbi:MAG: hypothetical protein FWB91_13060 [Defluviitaleaceae bacterium]|nr:hypothetical protein [Defluviitaleaceae bacterium]
MAEVKFIEATQEQIDIAPITKGQVIFTTDTERIYWDKSDTERVRIDSNMDEIENAVEEMYLGKANKMRRFVANATTGAQVNGFTSSLLSMNLPQTTDWSISFGRQLPMMLEVTPMGRLVYVGASTTLSWEQQHYSAPTSQILWTSGTWNLPRVGMWSVEYVFPHSYTISAIVGTPSPLNSPWVIMSFFEQMDLIDVMGYLNDRIGNADPKLQKIWDSLDMAEAGLAPSITIELSALSFPGGPTPITETPDMPIGSLINATWWHDTLGEITLLYRVIPFNNMDWLPGLELLTDFGFGRPPTPPIVAIAGSFTAASGRFALRENSFWAWLEVSPPGYDSQRLLRIEDEMSRKTDHSMVRFDYPVSMTIATGQRQRLTTILAQQGNNAITSQINHVLDDLAFDAANGRIKFASGRDKKVTFGIRLTATMTGVGPGNVGEYVIEMTRPDTGATADRIVNTVPGTNTGNMTYRNHTMTSYVAGTTDAFVTNGVAFDFNNTSASTITITGVTITIDVTKC